MKDSITTTIGCDLGDRYSHLCVLNREGSVVRRDRIATTQAGFRRRFTRRSQLRVVLEAGTHSSWVCELLKELGHSVIVANPRNVRLISRNRSKSDRVDAELLARLGRVDTMLLSPIKHRRPDSQRDLALVRARAGLVESRTKLINHVRSTVKGTGQRIAKCSANSFAKKTVEVLPQALRAALEPVLTVIGQTTEQIKAIEKTVEKEMPEKYPEMAFLQQVNGVGSLTALTFITTLDDPGRFKKSRQVGAYLGLRPARSQSGGKDPELRITKTGDTYLRSLLVNCAQHILGPFGKESDLRRWGLKLALRGKRNAKKRAVVAVARRLSVLLHRLWVTGKEYQAIGFRGADAAA